ncbi:MAG TPA: hypothetical protein VKZ93_09655 [Arenibacter sp.]|nr:hypothetical protein [Arenibacter sp.]
MIKYVIVTITILMFGNYSNNLFAQQKYEKESRLNRNNVPATAFNFIDSLNLKNRVKWYLEEGLENKSVEAKFKKSGKKHSVEFDILGNIEDVEIETKWDDLPVTLKNSISVQLKEDCIKHKIVKTQIQYTGKRGPLFLKILTGEPTENLTVRYEIIVKCRSKKNTELFEYLFTDIGQLIKATPIIFKPSNHLEY